MDLFAAAAAKLPVIASDPDNPPPRMAFTGVEWDEAAEARFCEAVAAEFARFPHLAHEEWFQAQTRKTAVWGVELDLLERARTREITAAYYCETDEEKRALIAKWRGRYCPLMVRDLMRISADYRARAKYGWRTGL